MGLIKSYLKWIYIALLLLALTLFSQNCGKMSSLNPNFDIDEFLGASLTNCNSLTVKQRGPGDLWCGYDQFTKTVPGWRIKSATEWDGVTFSERCETLQDVEQAGVNAIGLQCGSILRRYYLIGFKVGAFFKSTQNLQYCIGPLSSSYNIDDNPDLYQCEREPYSICFDGDSNPGDGRGTQGPSVSSGTCQYPKGMKPNCTGQQNNFRTDNVSCYLFPTPIDQRDRTKHFESLLECTEDPPYGDGWGWNGIERCPLPIPSHLGKCIDIPPWGDGKGWDGTQGCEIQEEPSSNGNVTNCMDTEPIGDTWGWDGERSCRIPEGRATTEVCYDSAPIGDGKGWNGSEVCEL